MSNPEHGPGSGPVASGNALLVIDAHGLVVFSNEAFATLSGYDEDLAGRAVGSLLSGRELSLIFSSPPDAPTSRSVRALLHHRDGSSKELRLVVAADALGAEARVVVSVLEDPPAVIASDRSITDALFGALTAGPNVPDEVVPRLLEVIATRLDFEVAALWWWEPNRGMLRCDHAWRAAGSGLDAFLEATIGAEIAQGEPVPGMVHLEQRWLAITDMSEVPGFRRAPVAIASGLKSGVALPIRSGGEVSGVFELYSRNPRSHDGLLIDAVGDAALRLGDFIEWVSNEEERARLLIDLRESERRQGFLLDAIRALATTRGLEETIEELTHVAVPAIGDLCIVDVAEADGSIRRIAVHHAEPDQQSIANGLLSYPPDPTGEHPAAIVIRTGRSLTASAMPERFMRDTTQSVSHFGLTQALGFASYVCAPLLSGDDVLGAITIVATTSGRRFGPDDVALTKDLAEQVASVLAREQRYDAERQITHRLQRSMLPEHLDAIEGLAVGARYLASNDATEVGGDFYDVVQLGERRAALVIGDVAGHDLTAITLMGKVRSALRAFLQVDSEPAAVLGALDRFVEGESEERMVTVALVILDVATGALKLANAGHPPPLLVGESVAAITSPPGPPAGFGAGNYEETTAHLDKGEALVFYTDGLTETRSGGAEARLHLLLDALGAAPMGPETVERTCDEAVRATLGAATPTDDVAFLLALRTTS